MIRETVTVGGVVQQDTLTTYDALGRIAHLSGPRYTLSYSYDAAGNRTRIMGYSLEVTVPSLRDLWYAYDGANRVTLSQGVNEGGVLKYTEKQGIKLIYNARGDRVQAVQYGWVLGYTDVYQDASPAFADLIPNCADYFF